MPPKQKKTPVITKKKAAATAAAAAAVREEEAEEHLENTDEEAASDTSSNTRKARLDRKLSDENEVRMLEFLQVNTCMWDMKKLEYRDTVKKNNLWEQLAVTMDGVVTSGHLKAAFKNLRNWYTKLDKDASKSGSAPRVLTGRDKQVQQRMQFMKNSVTHRPAPMVSAKPGAPNPAQSSQLIRSLDDPALVPRTPTKKRRPSSSASASISADADALEGLQTVMDRNTNTLQQIYSSQQKDDAAAVNLDDPLAASRAIKKSFCQYVTNCVMTYDESEFDQFQSAFTLLHERFKAERQEAQRRAAVIPLQNPHPGYGSSTTISQTSAPVPFQLFGSQGDPNYQPDPSQWLPQTPGPLQGSLYHSQSTEYNAQYRLLQQQQLQQQQQRQAGRGRAVPLTPRELPLPNISRLHNTSTPKRPKVTLATSAETEPEPPAEISAVMNFTDYINRTNDSPQHDSQQDALDGLEED